MNSNLYLDVENHSTECGNGYFNIINKNSGKYLEVVSNSTADGAAIGQWGPTGYGCQEWTIIKEGIQ